MERERAEPISKRKRVVIMVNLVAPYRVPVYETIGNAFETTILHSGHESNRTTWGDTLSKLKHCKTKKSWGFTIKIRKGKRGSVYDYRYLHLTPGYFWDLVRIWPSAVIGDEMGFRTVAALIFGSLFQKPVWVWWGGTKHNARDIGKIKKALRWIIVRWAKRWISYGQTSTEYLEFLGVKRERILQIQNCVDETLFSPDAQPALQISPKPVLLHVGQLTNLKGGDRLIAACAELRSKGKVFSLLLVGNGPQRETWERQARELGFDDITFVAGKKPEEMASIYRSADVLVFATLDDVWGLVVNEALLCGVPVLGSIYAGCVEEILPEQNRFDPMNHEQFVEILNAFLQGMISPADTSPLKKSSEVGAMIVTAIKSVIGE